MKRTAAHCTRADAAIHSKKTPSSTAQRLIAQWQLCNSWFKTANIGPASLKDGACMKGLKAHLHILPLTVHGDPSPAAVVKDAWL